MGGSPAQGRTSPQKGAGSAAALLLASAALCGGSAALIVLRHRLLAGVVALAAAATLVAGTVRARAQGDRPVLFAELIVDRIFDAAILAPVAWVWRSQSVRISVLALVGLAASYLASYERARGRSLGYQGNETVGYRVVRGAILAIGLLTGWVESALWALVVLTVSASSTRAWNVARQERRSPRTFGAST